MEYCKSLPLFAKSDSLSESETGDQNMPTMNISLPENLKEFVESQVQSGDYSSVSEFMRRLVRREQTVTASNLSCGFWRAWVQEKRPKLRRRCGINFGKGCASAKATQKMPNGPFRLG
jgi:hypothetical protein